MSRDDALNDPPDAEAPSGEHQVVTRTHDTNPPDEVERLRASRHPAIEAEISMDRRTHDDLATTMRSFLLAAMSALEDDSVDHHEAMTVASAEIEGAIMLLDGSRHAYRCRPGCSDCAIRDEPWRSNDVRIVLLDDPLPELRQVSDA